MFVDYTVVWKVNVARFSIYKFKDQALIELDTGDSTQKILDPVKHVCQLLSKEQNENFHNKIIFPLSFCMCFMTPWFHHSRKPSATLKWPEAWQLHQLQIYFQLTSKYRERKLIANKETQASPPKKKQHHHHKPNKQKKPPKHNKHKTHQPTPKPKEHKPNKQRLQVV